MKVITKRDVIRDAPKRWAEQYKNREALSGGKDSGEITDALLALDTETCTAADIDKIIGNTSWTSGTQCDECSESFDKVIHLGEPAGYDARWLVLCQYCLRTALEILKAAK